MQDGFLPDELAADVSAGQYFRPGVAVKVGVPTEVPVIQNHFTADEVDQASCAQSDPDAWYPEKGRKDSVQIAKRVCKTCPIRERCLEIALETDERYGVWGGLSERERRKLKKGRENGQGSTEAQ